VILIAQKTVYQNGEYLHNNPTWHIEDSPWKAKHVLDIMKKNRISPQSICEIGCGAGEILRQLQNQINPNCTFDGYEISPQAYALSQKQANPKLRFHLQNFLDSPSHFDLILLMDLIEHLEDYYGFLKKIHSCSDYKIIHMPLELTLFSILKPAGLQIPFSNLGHLHHFTKETALRTLTYCGYEIIDWSYTNPFTELPKKGNLNRLLKPAVKLAASINADVTNKVFGRNEIIVLAR
jgi:hypothetical protein